MMPMVRKESGAVITWTCGTAPTLEGYELLGKRIANQMPESLTPSFCRGGRK